MKRKISRLLLIAVSTLSIGLTSSCSTDELEDIEDDQRSLTDSYRSLQEGRAIRRDARQERTDAWFDRVMGD